MEHCYPTISPFLRHNHTIWINTNKIQLLATANIRVSTRVKNTPLETMPFFDSLSFYVLQAACFQKNTDKKFK